MANENYAPRTVTTLVVFGTGDNAQEGRISWDDALSPDGPSDAEMIAAALAIRAEDAFASVVLLREYIQGEVVDLTVGTPAFTL